MYIHVQSHVYHMTSTIIEGDMGERGWEEDIERGEEEGERGEGREG